MKIIYTVLFLSFSNLFAQSNCDDIHIFTDNQNGSTLYQSPLTFDMQYTKTITKAGDTLYNLYLQIVATYTNVNEKGCILYLSDGSKMEFPDQMITVNDMSLFRYKYSTSLILSLAEIKRLLLFDIVDFRLHIHNTTFAPILVKKKNAKMLSDYLKCIVAGLNK